MKRISGEWMEFGGVRASARYTRLMEMPRRTLPAVRGEKAQVPGREGFLWLPERRGGHDALDSITMSVCLETQDDSQMDAVTAWLYRGVGLLRFADEPDRAYEAVVIDGGDRGAKHQGFDTQSLTINFECQPYRYIYPAPAAQEMKSAGIFMNPGTAHSLPMIQVEGSGDITLSVGGRQVEITGGSVMIDSERMDCFNPDGATLANHRVRMEEFPVLEAGGNAISWTGSVSKVTITPRSRCI